MVLELMQKRASMRKHATHCLSTGDVKSAVLCMGDALNAEAELAQARLAQFRQRTNLPAEPEEIQVLSVAR